MPLYTDQTGREVNIPHRPARIISLVPSQTELLYSLGLRDEVCGITSFCLLPDSWYRSKTRVGGTKTLHPERIEALNPQLILANKEENLKEHVELLGEKYPVWVSDVADFDSAVNMILSVGQIVNRREEAEELANAIKSAFENYQPDGDPLQTAYLIWKDPIMVAGNGSFIDSMMREAGLINRFGNRERYPKVTFDELGDCDLILLSSEPFPFKEKHRAEFSELLPGKKIICVDGQIFSWYGSRMLEAPAYFSGLWNSINQ